MKILNQTTLFFTILHIAIAGVTPLAAKAQAPLPPPAVPEMPPAIAPEATASSAVPRVLPERIALVPKIPPFSEALALGDHGEEVRNLQRFLNQHGFLVTQVGPGSPGQETDYFGPLTRAAVRHYQEAYGAYVLAPAGTTDPSGIFGPLSLEHANKLMQYGFVNLFPKDDPTGQLASVGAVGTAKLSSLFSALSSIKNRLETIAQSFSSSPSSSSQYSAQ